MITHQPFTDKYYDQGLFLELRWEDEQNLHPTPKDFMFLLKHTDQVNIWF